jgi:hypothetical protein
MKLTCDKWPDGLFHCDLEWNGWLKVKATGLTRAAAIASAREFLSEMLAAFADAEAA